MGTQSTDLNKLAAATFREMKKVMYFAPVEIIGHKPSAQDLSQLREESHACARDLLESYFLVCHHLTPSMAAFLFWGWALCRSAAKEAPKPPRREGWHTDINGPGWY